MNEPRARAVAIASFAVSAVLCAGALICLVLAWDVPLRPAEFGTKGYPIAWSLGIGGVGAVIAARRPSNPIGWILCGMGVIAGVIALASEYARWALVVRAGRPPGGVMAAWFVEWTWVPLIVGLGVVGAIFPDGRPLSAAWRRALWIAIGLSLVPIVLNALIPQLAVWGVDNPVGIGGREMADGAAASTALLIPIVVVGAGAAVRRFRRSRGEERLQLKWIVLAMSVVASMFGVYGVLVLIQGTASPSGEGLRLLEYVTILSFLAVPFSIAMGVLKYRLYDIDIVINKAVVYGAIALFITVVYLTVVIGIGSLIGYASNPVLSAIAAAIVALAFQPARRRAQHLANRVVYGPRATPYEVLSTFAERLAGSYPLDDVLPRTARVVAEGTGAVRATIWLRTEDAYRPAATWPPDTDPAPLDPAFEVRHQGELLGAISVATAPNEPLAPVQEQLIRDVAGQAGLVLRNVRLLGDLRASRQRLVSAQDAERRRIERNIHDGAQQQLVALAVKQRLAASLIGRDDERACDLLDELQRQTNEALEDLRDLARGIYPPLLADRGLADALSAQARKSPIPIVLEPDGIGRYRQDVESAVYFSVLEALQNVAKYADASRAVVRLAEGHDELTFTVSDDGRGFDPSTTPSGTGLQGMADRLAAIGGALEIRSARGAGTTVAGRVPVSGGAA
jgi:signal transduction histidine kinase